MGLIGLLAILLFLNGSIAIKSTAYLSRNFSYMGRLNPYLRKCFLKQRIKYTAKSTASFNPAWVMLTRSGVNLVNPGPNQREPTVASYSREQPSNAISSTSSTTGTRLNKPWVIHIDSRSIVPHIDELRLIFRDSFPSVIAITETWLDDSVADSEVAISNYSVHRLDRRNNRRGGGVALYLLDGLKYTRRKYLEEESETIWIQVQLCNTKFLIGCVYRAPD